MKKLLLALLLGVGLMSQAFADQVLNDTAVNTIRQTNENLQRCGLVLASPFSPGLPYPPQDARFAVMNRYGRLLAYYRENYFGYNAQYYYSNPNGTYPHVIDLSNDRLLYSVPGWGQVATANTVYTPTGYGYNLFCRDGGYQYDWGNFLRCVDRNYTNVVTGQLCRWSNQFSAGGFGI